MNAVAVCGFCRVRLTAATPDLLRDDAERLLSVRPDLVLVRPMIERGYPAFVSKLEAAGVTVASLQPVGIDAGGVNGVARLDAQHRRGRTDGGIIVTGLKMVNGHDFSFGREA